MDVVNKGSIVFEVLDFNKILSNVSLGTAEISLTEDEAKLKRGHVFELALQKKGVPNGGVLVVVAKLCVSTLYTSEIKYGEIQNYPVARILMDEDIILPETLIKGFVVLSVPKRTKFESFHFSLERTLQFSINVENAWTAERKIPYFKWPNPVWRVQNAVELNPSESESSLNPHPFHLDMGTHVFAFELAAPKREISYFSTIGYANRALLRLEFESPTKTHVAEKGISFAQHPRFIAPLLDKGELCNRPRLPPTHPEFIPAYAAQFIPDYSGEPIPVELLYGGDMKAAYSKDLIENIKVEWPQEIFEKSLTQVTGEFDFTVVVTNEMARGGPAIIQLSLSIHRQIIAFRPMPSTAVTGDRSTLCVSHAEVRGHSLLPQTRGPIIPGAEPCGVNFKFFFEWFMGVKGSVDYSSTVETYGEAISVHWWVQLDAILGDNKETVPISKIPIFWTSPRLVTRQVSPRDERAHVDADLNNFSFAKVDNALLLDRLVPLQLYNTDMCDDSRLGTGASTKNQFCRSSLMHEEFEKLPKLRVKRSLDHKPIPHVPVIPAKPEDIEVVLFEKKKNVDR